MYLVEFSEPSSLHLRLVSAVDLGDVVTLDVTHRVGRKEAGEGNGQIVTKCQSLTTWGWTRYDDTITTDNMLC